MTIETDGRCLMVSEWRIAAPDITRNHHARETWLSFLRGTVTPRAPDLRFAGVLEAWACLGEDGRMWILEIHASEASVDEGMRAWHTVDARPRSTDNIDARLVRSYAGPLIDLAHVAPGAALRAMESDPDGKTGRRWINVMRWQIRAEIRPAPERFTTVATMIGPLVVREIVGQRPVMACVANTGDDTVVFAGLFTSASALEAAWQAVRRPGALREATERHLILTEFVAGEVIDLFALAAEAQIGMTPRNQPPSPIPASIEGD